MRRCSAPCALVVALLVTSVLAGSGLAKAYEASEVWKKGGWVWSLEGAYGQQFNPENHRTISDIEFLEVGARLSLLPFDIIAPDTAFRSAFEVGLEPIYVHYLHPHDAYYAGLGAVARYHFLGLGRFVPYVEVGGAAGGTSLNVKEIDSNFSFLLIGGVGASYFIGDRHAIYTGWRWTHNSNGDTESPNRGWDANTAVVGISVFLK